MPDVKQLSDSRQQRIVESVKRKIKHDPSLIAQHIGIPSGVKAISSQQERSAYWTPDPDVIADPQAAFDEVSEAVLMSAKPDDEPEATLARARALFALRLYPARMDLIRSGSRGLSVQEQIDFVNRMTELGPPNESEET